MEIVINTDLSIAGTKLAVDGKEVTKKTKVIGLSFEAMSPVKDSEYDNGYVSVGVTSIDEDDNVETKYYRKSEYHAKKVPMGVTLKDFVDKAGHDKVIRFVGNDVDTNIKEIADKIKSHCDENKIKCPDADILYNRTIESLIDKSNDLGIKLIDGESE